MVDALIGDVEKPDDVGIHYFLLDACVTFLGWPALFPLPPRGGAAPALMNYLVSNVPNFCHALMISGCRISSGPAPKDHFWF